MRQFQAGQGGRRRAGDILTDPAASSWIKAALRTALMRDCVDAANDAAELADVLRELAADVHEAHELAEGEGIWGCGRDR